LEPMMRQRRRIGPNQEDDFNVFDMTPIAAVPKIAAVPTGITTAMTGLSWAMATLSLLVGGAGIMNIMLVSVTKRTRKIGIRLAVGAHESQVLMQVPVEALLLSLPGGLLGILSGMAPRALGAHLLRAPFAVDARWCCWPSGCQPRWR
jgi:putative ABC transport system permease protein